MIPSELVQGVLLSFKTHHYDSDTRLRPFKLRLNSILYVNKGLGTLRTTDQGEIVLEPGTCVILKGDVSFELIIRDEHILEITLLQYRTWRMVTSGDELSAQWEIRDQVPLADKLAASISDQFGVLIEKLRPLFSDRTRKGGLRKQAIINELLLLEEEVAAKRDSAASPDVDLLQVTTEYMKHNYMYPIQITELAKMAGLTASSFCRAFKQTTGRTPGSYVTELRIEHAKQLMQQSDVKCKQISQVVGFQDELYFSRVFKKREGVSPTLYMKRNEQRVAIISGLNLQDQLLALGIRPIAAPSFPLFYGTDSGFPEYLSDRLQLTVPINAERTIPAHEVTSLSPDLILKTDFNHNSHSDEWQGATDLIHLDTYNSWESYQWEVARHVKKEREADRVIRKVKKAERLGERELASFTHRGKWTIVRLLPGDCRIYGHTGHAFTDLFYRDLKFQADDGLDYSSYRSCDLEALVSLDPENLLIIWSNPDTVASYMADPKWQELRAARENRVFVPQSKQWDPWGPIGRQVMIKQMTSYFLSFV